MITGENFRTMTYCNQFNSSLTPKQNIERLCSGFGNEATFEGTVFNWCSEFKLI